MGDDENGRVDAVEAEEPDPRPRRNFDSDEADDAEPKVRGAGSRHRIIDPTFAANLFGSLAKPSSILGASVIKGSGIIDVAISTGSALGRADVLSSGIGDALRLTSTTKWLTDTTLPLAGMVPQSTLNALSALPGLTSISSFFPDGFWNSWLPDLRFLDDLARYLPSAEEVERLDLPENLQDPAVRLDYEQWELWMQEGIPVAYVLDVDTIDRLEAASTLQERRRVISRRREQLTGLFAELLDDVAATAMLPYVDTARMALAGLADSHHQLAQTWAAVNLETLVKEFDPSSWSKLKDQSQEPPKLFRGFFFCGQLRVVMANVADGPVPTWFNRNASVHFTTVRRQFSKLNATLAIGHLVSAICNYDAAARQLAHRS